MRLTLVITNLDCGGAERVISIMANHWAEKGWPVTLLTFDDGSTPPFFELDPRIRLIPLDVYQASSNLLAALWNNMRRIVVLRRAIRSSQPDAVISFLYLVNVLVLLATRGLGVPTIVSEHNDPITSPIEREWAWLRRWTYTFKTRVVVLTQRAEVSFAPKIQSRTTVIPNPVTPITQAEKGPPEIILDRPSLVAMGSFYPQKGFDLLLEAFARLKDKYPDWTLTILGDGPYRAQIESIREELGLRDRVRLPGVVKNPHHVFKQADLFVMSSRWEGWGLALAEAMACGLPAIATDCRSGPREIIRDGVDGVLVPPEDTEALADAMARLMSDESKRKRLASRAVEINERFGVDRIIGMWEDLLRTLV
jgi:GalNAc-alpha-(1->4)-GalNAc-alpha-(1->3)-diNAcBac-PP-undecaprenol alpha-1,4-N-acetyl-D-galactosaminyltransferase